MEHPNRNNIKTILLSLLVFTFSCTEKYEVRDTVADMVIINGKVYTLSWPDPNLDGNLSEEAPFNGETWTPEAEAIAIKDKLIAKIGSKEEVMKWVGENTLVVDAKGGTMLPGLVDSHTHVINLGQNLELVDLTGVETEEEAVALIVEEAKDIEAGEWIIGKGWDEGAWASNYPDKNLLSERVPNHPVVMRSLHSFATWVNQMALDKAGIDQSTSSPPGGEIVKDSNGYPTGLFLNKGSDIIETAIPKPTLKQLKNYFLSGLNEMASSGYVAIHEAGVDRDLLDAILELDQEGKLPIRVYVMLNGENEDLLRDWMEKGTYASPSGMLTIRSVKAFYDGALGSRGAKLMEDYSDAPGSRGTSGQDYRFKPEILKEMASSGFQICIHAIGDAGNNESLSFLSDIIDNDSNQINLRHRIEHAQVISPPDFSRFADLNVIASMEPSHAVEDMVWAEDRLGPERIRGAYAWRTLRKNGATIIFNSDLTGTDHNIFYGLHSAITRQNKNSEPANGWYVEEAFTPEEAVRAFSTWAALSVYKEDSTGILAPGRWADISILTIDPFVIGATEPTALLEGEVTATIVGGKLEYYSNQ